MSKSDPSDNSRINLTDDADLIAKKIRKAKTDAGVVPATEKEMEDRPEVKNLVGIYSALSDKTDQDVLDQFAGQGFGAFKPALADLAVEKLRPITALMNEYMDNPGEVDKILTKGAESASEIATPIVADVRKVMGFWGA